MTCYFRDSAVSRTTIISTEQRVFSVEMLANLPIPFLIPDSQLTSDRSEVLGFHPERPAWIVPPDWVRFPYLFLSSVHRSGDGPKATGAGRSVCLSFCRYVCPSASLARKFGAPIPGVAEGNRVRFEKLIANSLPLRNGEI